MGSAVNQAKKFGARKVASIGAKRWCPMCEKGSGRFLSFGHKHRPEVQCPRCGSLDRHRLTWLYLTDHSGILDRRPRVLHMAPEAHLAHRVRPAAGTYVTLDLYAPGVDVRADITKPIPLDDDSFDLILCSHILEHVDDDLFAMRELVRLTARGGECLVMTPIRETAETFEDPSVTDPAERLRLFGKSDHVRFYGLDVIDRLTGAGFDVEPFVPAERFDPAEMERMRLAPGHRLLVCRPRI